MKLLEFSQRFRTEEDCERYQKEKREENGLKCTACGCEKMYWDKYNKKWICSRCGKEITLRSGTVMHGSKLPLMYWFTAIHLLTATKKTFLAKEIQRQLGHKRYQPIWEMVHKIRSVMGERDSQYVLKDTFELDEGYFTTEDPTDEDEQLKRGIGSHRNSKVLVMVESGPVENPKKGKKDRKCGHIKMKVIPDLASDTFKESVERCADKDSYAVMDNLSGHTGVEKAVAGSDRQTTPGKDAPKRLPWVHVAIANAKTLFRDMYHGIKEEFLQYYLDEFCYKFNRMYFGDRMFDRIVLAATSYKPTFKHRTYASVQCG